MHVSVNAYEDADLLDGCLASIRDCLPDATIQVVDGRYKTFPGERDNSTDQTPDVAREYGAQYVAGGPYPREEHKHEDRVRRAPADERLLFIDADERLLKSRVTHLDDSQAYRVRIHNALWYGADVTYYPRLFHPHQWDEVIRVDRFSFTSGVDSTDDITIVHRADLRSDAYRDRKSKRFQQENRGSWYDDHRATIDSGDHQLDPEECPNCGRKSVTQSRVCGFGTTPEYSRVHACTAGDRCHTRIEPVTIDDWQYLPDRVDRGFQEDVERVRVELMDAGNQLARLLSPDAFVRYQPNARLWVEDNLQDTASSPAP